MHRPGTETAAVCRAATTEADGDPCKNPGDSPGAKTADYATFFKNVTRPVATHSTT